MFELGLQEEHFNSISNGKKTVEGRLNKEKYQSLKNNDKIKFFKDLPDGTRSKNSISVKITKISKHKNWETFLKAVKLKNALPNCKTYNEGIKVYEKFYSKKDTEKWGIIAIYFKLLK